MSFLRLRSLIKKKKEDVQTNIYLILKIEYKLTMCIHNCCLLMIVYATVINYYIILRCATHASFGNA